MDGLHPPLGFSLANPFQLLLKFVIYISIEMNCSATEGGIRVECGGMGWRGLGKSAPKYFTHIHVNRCS